MLLVFTNSLYILGRNNDQRKKHHSSTAYLSQYLINKLHYFHQTMKTEFVSAYSNLENTICFTPKVTWRTVIHVVSHVKHEAIIL